MSIIVTHVKGPETGSPNKQLLQTNITIPLPAVLGRGALLKCAEKKVSRWHATLDWDDDGVIINAVNQNPTFVSVGGKKQKLSQGESAVLSHGDKFGLLEEAFWFRITLEDGTQTSDKENVLMNIIQPKQGHDNIKEFKYIQEIRNDCSNHDNEILKNKEILEGTNIEENGIVSKKQEENERTNTAAKGGTVSEYMQKNLPHLHSSFDSKKQLNEEVENSIAISERETEIMNLSPKASTSKQLSNTLNQEASKSSIKEVKVNQILYTQKDLDEAVSDRKRTLPAWMMGSASSTNKVKGSTSDTKENNAVQHGRKNMKVTSKKQDISEVKVDKSMNNVEKVEIKGMRKKSPQKTPSKTTPSKYHGMSQNDDEMDDDLISETEKTVTKNISPLKKSPKASPSKKTPSKYNGLIQELSHEETSNKEDIEMKNSSNEIHHDISDDGSDENESSPEIDLPSPRKLQIPNKKSPSIDIDDGGSKVLNKTINTVGNRLAGVTSTDDDDGGRGQKRPAPRGSCAYGSQCYRKNPQHKEEYAHPGDSDYNEDDDDDDDDDERPECEFGVDCYRKNPQHKKQFKHTRFPQPQRKAKRKAKAKKNNADDSESDDYDYDDPFLNDDSSDDYAPTDSGSDTNMEDNDEEEDTARMLKEGKKFIKRN